MAPVSRAAAGQHRGGVGPGPEWPACGLVSLFLWIPIAHAFHAAPSRDGHIGRGDVAGHTKCAPCQMIYVSGATAMAAIPEPKQNLHPAVSSELKEKLLEKDESRPVITQNIADEDLRGDKDPNFSLAMTSSLVATLSR